MCHPVECVEFCGCASCFPPSGAPPFYLFSLLRDIKALPVAPSRLQTRIQSRFGPWDGTWKYLFPVLSSRMGDALSVVFLFSSRSDPNMSHQEMSKLFESK